MGKFGAEDVDGCFLLNAFNNPYTEYIELCIKSAK